MSLVHSITMYMALSIVLIVLIFIGFIIIFVLASRKKTSISEIYYDTFERKDTMEYLKYDEIISSDPNEPLKGAGMMVVNGKTFVGMLSVTGYNFFSSSYDTQVNTINSTISFFDSLEYPISLRQTVKSIDISHNIQEHQKQCEIITTDIQRLHNQITEILEDAEDYVDDNPELSQKYMDDAARLMDEMERKKRQLGEAEEMIKYMNEVSTLSGDSQKIQNIIYSYTFDNSQFTSQLTKEEIYFQAMNELENRANALISQLYRMGCTARRLRAEEMVDLMRRHMHPATADDTSLEELFNSNLNSLFVTSESLLDVVKEQMTEEMYRRKLAAIQTQIEEAEKRNRLLAERAEDDRLEITKNMASSQVHL